jgi:hypothetical protein
VSSSAIIIILLSQTRVYRNLACDNMTSISDDDILTSDMMIVRAPGDTHAGASVVHEAPMQATPTPPPLEQVPRPEGMTLQELRDIQETTNGALLRVEPLVLTLEQRLRLAAYEAKAIQGLVYRSELVEQFASAAPGVAPPLFELNPRHILPVQPLLQLERGIGPVQRYVQQRTGLCDKDVDLDGLVTQLEAMRITPAPSALAVPLWSHGTRTRPAMVVPDAHEGPIAAASMRIPLITNGVSYPSATFLLPLLFCKTVAALCLYDDTYQGTRWYAEVWLDSRPDADGEYRYTLLLRLASAASLKRRGLWSATQSL